MGLIGVARIRRKLREVALIRPTDHENNVLFLNNPQYFMMRQPLLTGVKPNLEWLKENIEDYAKILEENGVRVRWMEYDDVMGAYGPMRKLWVARNLGMVIYGGAIILRFGHGSFLRGTDYFAQKFFSDIRCPILLKVVGKGLFEGGAMPWVAENVVIGSYGISANQEGVDQVSPILRASGVQLIMGASTTIMDSFESGGDFHMDMVLCAPDIGLATVFPAQLDYQIYLWLKQHKFRLLEVPADEQVKCVPCNGMVLGQGKIVMPSVAKKTNALLRKEGVDVIELDAAGIVQGGVNGIRCMTLSLLRDPGPSLEEIR